MCGLSPVLPLLRCSEVLDSLNSDRDIMPLIEDLSTKFALVRWVESRHPRCSVRPRDHLRSSANCGVCVESFLQLPGCKPNKNADIGS
jgi:hypothetical protein